jgi:glycosyltransferase involved in cell wall biosynthesis
LSEPVTRPSEGRVRVLVVTPSRLVWGAERSVLGMAPLLREVGVDLVLGSPPGGELEAAWRELRLERDALDLPVHAGLRPDGEGGGRPSPRGMLKELAATVRTVPLIARAARTVDVVHSNGLWGHVDCAMGARLARRPVVIELHDLVVPGMGRHLLSAASRMAVTTVAVSTAVAGVVGDGSGTGVRVVTQAVDLERFSPGPPDPEVRRRLTDDPDGLLVGIVGRLDPMKGIDVLVKAMALLSGPAAAARLVVVGSPGLDLGGYEHRIHGEAADLLGERARFLGAIEDVPPVLRAVDVLVNASAAEPFGLTVLEAQACGMPVVAPSSGGIPDFVVDNDNGLLVPPSDPAALARALERLLGDAALRERLGRRGRETAAANHSLTQRAHALAAIYRAAARKEPVS